MSPNVVKLLLVIAFSTLCHGFYIPGVAPTEYRKGDVLDIKV